MGAKLGPWIRTKRSERGLSQAALAKKLEVGQPQMSQWERGAQAPSPAIVQRLTSLFGGPSRGGSPGAAASRKPADRPPQLPGLEAGSAPAAAKVGRPAVLEDRDEYVSVGVFWVPRAARWPNIRRKAKQPTIGELVDLIGSIPLGDREHRSRDVLGRVYDPCCGSGGMFVQSEPFIEEHGGRLGDISIYGQEMNYTTWRMAKMNLAIRGLKADLGPEPADTFHRDLHPDLRADYLLANPPFNMSDWGGDRLRHDVRWKYGVPPVGNANYAWVQHFFHHLAPRGMAGFVMANGSMSSNSSGEGEIRQAMVEADLVDSMIAMPGQLFYSTQIPVCLWFLTRAKLVAPLREQQAETARLDAAIVANLTGFGFNEPSIGGTR